MIRSVVLVVAILALSGGSNPALAQAVVAVSCFELRVVQEMPAELPDTLRVVVLNPSASEEPEGLLEHEGLVFGQFVSDLLRVAIVPEGAVEPEILWFRPEGDRMVGWRGEYRSGPPDIEQPWQVEAHRFPCGRLSPR